MAMKPMDSPPKEDVEQDIGEWFRDHSQRLLRYFQSNLGNRSDAEDMLQATMLKVIKTYDSSRGNLGSWVWHVARCQLADAARRSRVRNIHLSPSGDRFENIKKEEDQEQRLNWLECRLALDKLSEQQRVALFLSRLLGQTQH